MQGVRGRRAGLDDGTGYFEAVDLDAGSLPLTPAEGDRVTIDDVAYRVVDVGRSDPYGLTTLSLERQA